jgi:transcriptional antiterminator NusG
MQWYVVHAYSGMEKAVERNITERSCAPAWNPNLVDLVPTEEVVEIKMDRRRRQSVGFPGYVLVEMVMDDELGTW